MANPVINPSVSGSPLDQLRPIIFPDYDISIWPLAIGWWLLLGLILLLIAIFFVLHPFLKARHDKKKLLENTLSLLNALHTECALQADKPKALQNYLQKSNDIFKRLIHTNKVLSPFAQLTGQHWIAFIEKTSTDVSFTQYYGDSLYAAQCNDNINLTALHNWASTWVKQVSKNAERIARESVK